MDKELLGAALKAMADTYNNIEVEDLEAARVNFWKGVADEIIKHLTANAVVNVNVTTTGSSTAHTGTGTGGIS